MGSEVTWAQSFQCITIFPLINMNKGAIDIADNKGKRLSEGETKEGESEGEHKKEEKEKKKLPMHYQFSADIINVFHS